MACIASNPEHRAFSASQGRFRGHAGAWGGSIGPESTGVVSPHTYYLRWPSRSLTALRIVAIALAIPPHRASSVSTMPNHKHQVCGRHHTSASPTSTGDAVKIRISSGIGQLVRPTSNWISQRCDDVAVTGWQGSHLKCWRSVANAVVLVRAAVPGIWSRV